MKKVLFALAVFMLLGTAGWLIQAETRLPSAITEKTQECIDCHKEGTPGIYQHWGRSKHFSANVGCYECHQAQEGEADAFEHNDEWISIIVSPKDCGRCHAKETDEFLNSHHSKSGRIMGSLDNILAEVVEGNRGLKTEGFPDGISAAAVNGCWQCHGSEVKVLEDGELDPATWPNTGMGRINPDGSEGACSSCHFRHEFSATQARQPENCGKCHMGPDHPQLEVFRESKHGIAYYANKDKMNMDSPKWVVGEDYFAAPTCATCHMSATKEQGVTHNVGLRLKWNNRPPISKLSHETDKKWGLKSAAITADKRQENMKDVCSSCHAEEFADNFYMQYEGLLDLYHDKYARPGLKLYGLVTKVLKAVNGDKYAKFAQMVDFTWFELWHHEGRRARHGASMGGPDYTHWHGTYDLAKHWYGKFVPEIKEVIEAGKESDNKEAVKLAGELEDLLEQITNDPNHRWSVGKEDEAAKKKRSERQKAFLEKYK